MTTNESKAPPVTEASEIAQEAAAEAQQEKTDAAAARIAELELVSLLQEMGKRRLRVNVVGKPQRVPACFVHGYTSLPVELERY